MSPRHFSKVMFSPYFQSDHYQETEQAKLERKIERFFKKIFKRKNAKSTKHM